jgi:hypothetical protein
MALEACLASQQAASQVALSHVKQQEVNSTSGGGGGSAINSSSNSDGSGGDTALMTAAIMTAFNPRWRLEAVESQLASVLRRERRQKLVLATTTKSCTELEGAVVRVRSKRGEALRRLKELHEEVNANNP